jgi:NTE family protein
MLLLANRGALGADTDGEVADLIWDHALSSGPNHLLLGTRLHTVWGQPGLFDGLTPLGGFTNLSGFAERELLNEHAALFRGVYYRRLGDAGQLFSVPTFAGASAEAGNVFDTRADMLDLNDLLFAGSLFVGIDSPFGPIVLGFGHASSGDSSVYLNFGSLLRPRL